MNFNIKDRTILLALVGSRGYGTNNPDSDWDYKGICIPPIETYITNNNHFEQNESKLSNNEYDHLQFLDEEVPRFPENNECVRYDIKKYFQLATACNPNILEILFTDPKNLIICNKFGVILLANKELFLSKKVRHSYAGYAHAQLKKIRSHRSWLMGEIPKMPIREEFGLPAQPLIDHAQLKAAMSMVDKQIETWTMHPEEEIPITVLTKARESIYDLVAWVMGAEAGFKAEEGILKAATYKLGFDSNFSEYIIKQKQYNSALSHFKSYNEWKKNRNPKRAALEAKMGYDGKHASHLVRLLRTCNELMTTGKLLVNRPDAEDLISIRNGAWTYDKLEEYTDSMNNKLDKLYQDPNCPLVYSPDLVKIDNLLKTLILDFNDKT